MTNDVLVNTMPAQRQSQTATDNHPIVLMDDSSYTMDDPRAFMGNQTVNSSELATMVGVYKPKVKIVFPSF